MTFAERLKKTRLDKGISQTDLGKAVGIHYTQIGRYENKGSQPSAEVLSKIADALDTSTDFLMYGSRDEIAGGISDKELVTQFKRITKLPEDRKFILKELIDAFLFKSEVQQKLAS